MTISNRTAYLTVLPVLLAMLSLPAHAAADPGNGQRLYLAHCAGCHGEKGVSIMPQAPNFANAERLDQPDHVLVDRIRSGGGAMPPFLGILNDREMLDVVGYIRTLR